MKKKIYNPLFPGDVVRTKSEQRWHGMWWPKGTLAVVEYAETRNAVMIRFDDGRKFGRFIYWNRDLRRVA